LLVSDFEFRISDFALSTSPSSAITIKPVTAPICGRIRPPGSKSITNRALVCAALARGTSTLTGALDSEDTRVMIESLGRLGIRVESHEAGKTLIVHGCGGNIPAKSADLFVGNSGTTIRFLTALCALGRGAYRLDGVPRMRERPIGDLVDALNQLGADCRGELRTGFPPVIVNANGLRGGNVSIRGDISSQFLSGLLMATPYADGDVHLEVQGELVSEPYVAMTYRIMEAFGARLTPTSKFASCDIPASQSYEARTYAIEPDASAASYFWAAAAITGGEVTVEGLSIPSLQGDVWFVELLERMGCQATQIEGGITVRGRAKRGIEIDMCSLSDTVQTLAAVALFVDGPTTIRGVAHIRHKETDRIGDLARELRKFGATVEEFADGLRITPPPNFSAFAGATIETYHDHRMAMSLALPGLILPRVIILNPGCTAKTYPKFFDELARLIGDF
jgi:3-phosphoshikimate 1-carboxyvinyltransferase